MQTYLHKCVLIPNSVDALGYPANLDESLDNFIFFLAITLYL